MILFKITTFERQLSVLSFDSYYKLSDRLFEIKKGYLSSPKYYPFNQNKNQMQKNFSLAVFTAVMSVGLAQGEQDVDQTSKDGWTGYLNRGDSSEDASNKQAQTYYNYYPSWYNEPTYTPLPPAPMPEDPWEPTTDFGGGGDPEDPDTTVEDRLAALEQHLIDMKAKDEALEQEIIDLKAKDNGQDDRLGPLESVQAS